MGKTGQPSWAKRILKLLEQAKAKDPDFERFGAYSHQYRLAAPASEEQILKFEEQQGIRLPEEFRDFLLHVGNGGAGPYYGLYGIRDLGDGLHDSHGARIYRVQEEPVIYPKMSDEEWNRMTAPESRQGDSMGKGGEAHPYVGVLPIGSQGCTLMTGLMLAGPYRGQVVYCDEDYCGPPFFVREKGFLSWYERWLREVIAGYSNEETGFGMNIDGNPTQLMELYEQAQDPEEKIEIIDSYYKFETLPGKQKTYFKQACARESDMEVRMKLIKMMARFHVPGMAKELETLWEYGAYAEAVSIITYEGTWEVKEAWYEKVFEILPKLHGEGFRDACHTISAMKEYPNVHAGRLKEALGRDDLDRNDRIALFHCIKDLKGKEEVLDYFLEYLSAEEDPGILIYAVWCTEGVEDRQLQELFVKLMDKYRTHENTRFDYKGSQMVLKGGACMGASRPEGQLTSNLMRQFDYFGLDYRGAWKLLMDDGRWREWKGQNGFL
nr:SMI1/KNR4 family protein [uncultured Acetatifactor sp.]